MDILLVQVGIARGWQPAGGRFIRSRRTGPASSPAAGAVRRPRAGGSWAWSGARSAGERLQQVADQVVGVLEADRGAQEVGGGGRVGALDRGAVLDQALGAAQAGGVEEEAQAAGDAQGVL